MLPAEGEPAAVAIVQGDGQTAKVGAALDDSLVVRVTDTRDRPVADATVAFVLIDGSGQITINAGQLRPDTVRTDADGRAASRWTLGASAGAQRAEARVVGAANPLIAKFTATAGAGRAAALAAVSGDKQSAPAGAPLPDSLVVRASDAAGNPVAGASVTWSVTGGGSVSAPTTATDAAGLTAVQRILGPNAGAQAAVARTAGVSAPVIFTATATAGSAARISIISGNNQSAAAGSALPAPLVVRIVDADANGVPGRSVAWVIGQGGGSANPATSKTDANGQASTSWTLGPAAGTNTLTAVVSDVGSVVFTASAGPSGSRSGVSASPTTFVAGQGSSNVTVTVRDAGGNPLSGIAVRIAASGDGNTIAQPNGPTN
ncbi:MAG TPA: Ig-like domain-containing protein, partial [Gemmatimonadales bacterium]|nr:Ig-like domain-containing protein [Gemmatimonadales bacterium]